MMLRRTFLLLALAIAGCAHVAGWQNPNLPPAQWRADESACRNEAEEDLGPLAYSAPDSARFDTHFGPLAYSAPDSARFDTPPEMVTRSEIHNQFATAVAECMERKGYRRSQ